MTCGSKRKEPSVSDGIQTEGDQACRARRRIKAWKAQGPEGLNRKPGPKPGPRKLKAPATYNDKRSALTRANTRIAELERLVGRQQIDLDFFRQALRALERPAAQGKPAPASSKSSKP
jgi:transposase